MLLLLEMNAAETGAAGRQRRDEDAWLLRLAVVVERWWCVGRVGFRC